MISPLHWAHTVMYSVDSVKWNLQDHNLYFLLSKPERMYAQLINAWNEGFNTKKNIFRYLWEGQYQQSVLCRKPKRMLLKILKQGLSLRSMYGEVTGSLCSGKPFQISCQFPSSPLHHCLQGSIKSPHILFYSYLKHPKTLVLSPQCTLLLIHAQEIRLKTHDVNWLNWQQDVCHLG